MRDEIRERIEKIQKGEIPEGYIKANEGIFPYDWDKVKLSQLLKFQNGINADADKFGQGIRIVSVTDILNARPIIYENINGMIDINEDMLRRYSVKYGDILFQRSSENIEDAGKSNVYIDDKNTATFGGFVIRGKKIADYNPIFLNEVLKRQYIRKQIMRRAAGVQHINIGQESLNEIIVYLPNKEMQIKIADIISLFEKREILKERLILEKVKYKKYLEQNLLTGNVRLKGFFGKWEKTKLKKVLHERKKYSAKGFNYEHVTLSRDGIYPKSERYDRDHLVKNEEKQYKVTHLNDICYNPANLKFGVICRNIYGDAIFSPIYITFEVDDKHDIEFISQYLMRWNFINAVRKYEEGTVYERMAVSPKDFLSFEVILPKIEEQKAIAHILFEADKEIELLQQQLEQIKYEKKAILQLLLTGIVRVNQRGGE